MQNIPTVPLIQSILSGFFDTFEEIGVFDSIGSSIAFYIATSEYCTS
jgi:hypothetical protein